MSMKNSLLNEGYNSGAPLFTKGKEPIFTIKKTARSFFLCWFNYFRS